MDSVPLNFAGASPGKVMAVDADGLIAPSSTLLADLATAAGLAAAVAGRTPLVGGVSSAGGFDTGEVPPAPDVGGASYQDVDGTLDGYYGYGLVAVDDANGAVSPLSDGQLVNDYISGGGVRLIDLPLAPAGVAYRVTRYSDQTGETRFVGDPLTGTTFDDDGSLVEGELYAGASRRVVLSNDPAAYPVDATGTIHASEGFYTAGQAAAGSLSVQDNAYVGGQLDLYGPTNHFGVTNFGGGYAGHAYFDASGDLVARSGQTFSIRNAAYGNASVVAYVHDGYFAVPYLDVGHISNLVALNVNTFGGGTGIISGYGNSPLYLTPYGAQPLVLGATTTTQTANVIDVALPAVFRRPPQPPAINTGTTMGTATGQVAVSSATGKLVIWNNASLAWQAAV